MVLIAPRRVAICDHDDAVAEGARIVLRGCSFRDAAVGFPQTRPHKTPISCFYEPFQPGWNT